MRYLYYREIASIYSKEPTEYNTIRSTQTTWTQVQLLLKTAIADLAKIDPSLDPVTFKPRPVAPACQKGTVKQKAAFFNTTFKQATATQLMGHRVDFAQKADAIRRIENCREWLRREGASADAQGNVQIALMPPSLVLYDTQAAQQGLTKVIIEDGLLYTEKTGQRSKLDTTDMVTHASGPGLGIYVRSAEGNLHVASHVEGQYRTVSLPASRRGGLVARGPAKSRSKAGGRQFRPSATRAVTTFRKRCTSIRFWIRLEKEGGEELQRQVLLSVLRIRQI